MIITVNPDGEATVWADEQHERIVQPEDVGTRGGPQVDALAWSLGEPPEMEAYPKEQHSWPRVLGWAAAIVAVPVVAVGFTVHVLLAPHHASAESVTPVMPSFPSPATEEAAAPDTFVMPPEPAAAAVITDDGRYLQLIRAPHLGRR